MQRITSVRLNGIKAMFDQLIVGLSMRQERGVLPPKFVFARVLDDSQNIITGKPFDRSSEIAPSTRILLARSTNWTSAQR